MTKVTLKKERGRRRIEVAGHAGDSLVCSAASMLTCTLAEALMRQGAECSLETADGNAVILVENTNREAELAINVIMAGFELLGENFPKNVDVINE